MDVLQFRFKIMQEIEKTVKSPDVEINDPLLTKPCVFHSIREIVARYSRGEIVYRSEDYVEQAQYDDEIIPRESYKSSLDRDQRVSDFVDAVRDSQSQSSEPVSSIDNGAQTTATGSEPATAD